MKKHSMKIILSFPQYTRLNIKVEYTQKPNLKQKFGSCLFLSLKNKNIGDRQ